MAHGIVMAFLQSETARSLVRTSIMSYFRLTSPWTIKAYDRFIDSWYRYPVANAPTHYFYSSNDPMSDATVVRKLIEFQKDQGYDVSAKYWEKSGHTQHLALHRRDYLRHLDEFLLKVDRSNPLLLE